MAKQILIIQTSPAYGTLLPAVGLDTLLGATTVFEQVDVLLLGAAQTQLNPDQDPTALQQKPYPKLYQTLGLYDIEQVFVDPSAEGKNLPHAQVVDPAAMTELLSQYDLVLKY